MNDFILRCSPSVDGQKRYIYCSNKCVKMALLMANNVIYASPVSVVLLTLINITVMTRQ